jgi:hypothetical protein
MEVTGLERLVLVAPALLVLASLSACKAVSAQPTRLA